MGCFIYISTLSFLRKLLLSGNFREVRNTVHCLFALGKEVIEAKDLPKRFFFQEVTIDESYESILRLHRLKIYQRYNKNMAATCKALGHTNPSQLKKKFEKWGILRESGKV